MSGKRGWSAKDREMFGRIAARVRPYTGRLVLAVLCGMLFGGSLLGLLGAGKAGLAQAFGEKATAVQNAVQGWVEHVYAGDAGSHSALLMGALMGLLVLLGALRGLSFFLSKYLIEWVAQRVIMELRNDLFGKILHLPLLYFTGSRTGELMSRTLNDTQLIEKSITEVICDLVQQPFVLLGAAGALLMVDWRLAAISLAVFPVCILPVAMFGRRVRRHAKVGQERLADLSSIQQESIVGAAIVKAFGAEERELERFERHNGDFFRRQVKIVAARAAVNPLMELFCIIGACLVLVYARAKGLQLTDLIVFLVSMVAMYDPAKKLSRVHLMLQQASASAERVFAILDEPATVRNREGAAALEGAVECVEYRGVGFRYAEGGARVLEGMDLTARKGELVALVGGSGAGKTTLVNLLPRFFDVTEGAVLVNGRDVRDYTLESLRGAIGLVTQETFLFNDSVAANIAYGKPGATREEVEAAARLAHADEFIRAMPEGYDTVIAERGALLSGGQRQRLAIARALLRNPPILILDEATSALDTESERAVQAALDAAMKGRTVFAIAHRLSTIQRADQILVLDHGKVAERGRHEELLARHGLYERLYRMQFDRPGEEAAK